MGKTKSKLKDKLIADLKKIGFFKYNDIEKLVEKYLSDEKRYDVNEKTLIDNKDEYQALIKLKRDIEWLKVYDDRAEQINCKVELIENCKKIDDMNGITFYLDAFFYGFFKAEMFHKLVAVKMQDKYMVVQDLHKVMKSYANMQGAWNTVLRKFKGNPIEKRKGGRLEKYKRIITLIKCMNQKFKVISGIENKACNLEKVNASTFNRFKNRNIQRYQKIYDDISEEELDAVTDIIRKEYFQ